MGFFKRIKQMLGAGKQSQQEEQLSAVGKKQETPVQTSQRTSSTLPPAKAADKPINPADEKTYEYQVLDDQSVMITRFLGEREVEHLYVPSSLGGKIVTAIGTAAFVESFEEKFDDDGVLDDLECQNNGITPDYIHLPESITSIGDYAFSDMDYLYGVNLPPSLKSIGKAAFRSCNSLDIPTLPRYLETIGEYAFSWSGIKSLKLPQSIQSIGAHSFQSCNRLETVSIPDHITMIDSGTFSYCGKLASIKLPKNLVEIKYGAFSSIGAQQIHFPEGLISIGSSAFSNCKHLTEAILPAGLEKLEGSAFARCPSLNKASMPAAILLDGSVWSHCPSLSELRLTQDGREPLTFDQDGVFFNKSKQLVFYPPYKFEPTYTVPTGTSAIRSQAFAGHPHVKSVTLRADTTFLDFKAFSECEKLQEIVLGKRVTYLSVLVFDKSNQLTIYADAGSQSEKTIAKYNADRKAKGEVLVSFKPLSQRPKAAKVVASTKAKEPVPAEEIIPTKDAQAKKTVIPRQKAPLPEQATTVNAQELDVRRVVVDQAFSIIIPENHEYSLDPPGFRMGATSWEHVLVTVSEGDDIENYHEADEQIAVRQLLSAGILSYTDIQSEEGQGYIDNVVNQLTDDGEIEWEILVDEPDLIVGYLERSYFQKTYFTAGIFTNKGLYHMSLAFEYGGKAGNDPQVREVLRSIRPIRDEETKTFTGIGELTGPKALRQTKTTQDEGERILVDNAWSIRVPDGFKASVDPKVIEDSMGSRVLAVVPKNMDLGNVFEGEDSISAIRLPFPAGLYQRLTDPVGRQFMDMAVDSLTATATSKWEYLVHREDLVVGLCENTPFGPTRFSGGVFTRHGMYSVLIFISHGNKESKHKKAREYLQTIREVNEAIADSVSEKPKPKSKPAQKKVTLSMVRSNLDMVKPQGEGYYDFMVKRMAGNWVANLFVDAVQQTGFINLVGDYSIYQMAKLDSPTEAKPYPYTRHAMEMAEVFHNSALPEDEQSSYYTNINKAQIARFEMLELFQSFAWCVHNYSKNTGMPVAELPLETLMLIVKAIEGWENVCYTEDSYCPELCRIMAYNNFFSLHAKSHTQTKEFMQKENLGDEKYGSLKALREELAAIYEPVRKLHSQLAEDKSADELSDNALMAIVSVWCSFAVAANDPFQMRQAKSEEQELPAPDPVEWEKQFDLVGTGYEGRPAAHESLKVGEMVNLVRNPDNIYDSNAIEVFNSAGNSLGHIPGHFAASWAPRLDAGTMEILSAEVTNVVPLSQRSARAKNPLTSILLKYRTTL